MDKKNIVKEIFERPKEATGKISTIFTHFRPSSRPLLHRKPSSSSAKALPAAIDIGTSIIKLFQLAEESGKLEIINIDREAYSGDKKDALEKIVKRNDVGPKVLTAIAAKDVQIYNLSFPQMSEAELKEAAKWKLSQLRPFGLAPEEVTYDIIKWSDAAGFKSTQQKILLACVPKSLAQATVDLFGAVGLELLDIQVGPISLVSLAKFLKPPQAKSEITVWLDLGAHESTLIITKGEVLYFCRSLSLTSQSLTKNIIRHFRISETEAESLKKEYGLSSWSADKKPAVFSQEGESSPKPKDKSLRVYYSLISMLENLVVDIEHSFKYFSYQVTQSQIVKFDRVILCGGAAELKNLDNFLRAKLGVPVEKINPLSLFEFSAAVENKKQVFLPAAAQFTISAAMAISSKTDRSKQLSLIPKQVKKGKEYLKERLKEKPIQAALLVGSLAVSLMIFQIARTVFYSWEMNSLGRQVRSAQSQLSSFQIRQLKLAKIEGEFLEKKAELESRLALLEAGSRDSQSFSNALVKMADLLPQAIWIKRLLYKENKLNIIGSSSKISTVMELLETLKASEEFSSASFNYTQKAPDKDVYDFEIVTEIKQ